MRQVIAITFFVFLLAGCKTKELSQKDQNKYNAISAAIEARRYIFEPTSAIPLNYQMISLQPGYYLEVSGDTIKADLPYYGRSYTAPVDPTRIGINFISEKFEYSIQKKKDGWDITIKPKDIDRRLELYLSIGKTGFSSLRVFDVNRQNISYYGNVESTLKE